MKLILLTGATGMVGRNILESSWVAKYNIVAPSHGELDLRDFSAVAEYVQDIKPDLIIHAAGRVGGIQANTNYPVEFLIENLDLGRNIVMAAMQAGVPELLNLGSSCMYPRNLEIPLKEEFILTGELEPTNEAYAIAKITVAKLCQFVSRQKQNLQYKTVIPCNLYGRWDKFDVQRSHMIPAVIAKIVAAKLDNHSKVEIWGDGLARREFMYAADLADFIGIAIERFEDLPAIMNVGLGYDYTINEYYERVAKVVDWAGEFCHDLSKPSGMSRKLCDVSLLKSFGWKATTSLEEGLHRTLEFYLQEPQL